MGNHLVKSLVLSQHSVKRMHQRNISRGQIINTVKFGNMEYVNDAKYKPTSQRVMFVNNNLTAIVALEGKQAILVTAYYGI